MRQDAANEQLSARCEALLAEQAPRLLMASSLDVLTLRAHATLEAVLRDLLVCRLAPRSARLPDLTFAKLVELALADMPRRLTELVLSINRIRNYTAHHLNAEELSIRVGAFVRGFSEYNISWPDDEADQKVGWSLILFITIVAISVVPQALLEWRAGDEALRSGRNEDEPAFLAHTGEWALRFLNLQPWLSRLVSFTSANDSAHSDAAVLSR